MTPTINTLSISKEDLYKAWVTLLEYRLEKLNRRAYKAVSLDAKATQEEFNVLYVALLLKK